MAETARPVGRPRTSPAPDGYYEPDAVAARRAYMVEYKARNAENLKTYYKAWRAAHPEKHMQYNREWAARDRARRAAAAVIVVPRVPPPLELPNEHEPPADPVAIRPESARAQPY